jgi:hypothetical protein
MPGPPFFHFSLFRCSLFRSPPCPLLFVPLFRSPPCPLLFVPLFRSPPVPLVPLFLCSLVPLFRSPPVPFVPLFLCSFVPLFLCSPVCCTISTVVHLRQKRCMRAVGTGPQRAIGWCEIAMVLNSLMGSADEAPGVVVGDGFARYSATSEWRPGGRDRRACIKSGWYHGARLRP